MTTEQGNEGAQVQVLVQQALIEQARRYRKRIADLRDRLRASEADNKNLRRRVRSGEKEIAYWRKQTFELRDQAIVDKGQIADLSQLVRDLRG
ncbi:MAG: hypothetical protein L0Z62_43425 [Gemmataceae bacterium]|nr:hypothetical protein [Gemmataceae bacterium]